MKALFREGFLAGIQSAIQSSRNELIFVSAVAVAAGLLRFYRIDEKSIWLDEAFSLWIARHSLWESWRWLIRIDQHPPLYYSLLHLWIGVFGDLPGAVRALSALASTLTVPLFYAAARRLLDWPAAAIAEQDQVFAQQPHLARNRCGFAASSYGMPVAPEHLSCRRACRCLHEVEVRRSTISTVSATIAS